MELIPLIDALDARVLECERRDYGLSEDVIMAMLAAAKKQLRRARESQAALEAVLKDLSVSLMALEKRPLN